MGTTAGVQAPADLTGQVTEMLLDIGYALRDVLSKVAIPLR